VPSRQNIRRHGWKKLYVVVSSKKIIFFNSETERQNADPTLILDLSKVFHVRSVTQGDVIRAEAKDIPRIFQVRECDHDRQECLLFFPHQFRAPFITTDEFLRGRS